ncbi:MAG: GNAT family N-acetyltransferase [Bacteroidota bacterium]
MGSLRTTWYGLTDPGGRSGYADLYVRSPQRTVFSGLAFADAACAAYGLDGRIALVHNASAAVAGIVVFEKRWGPYRAASLPLYAEYSTPLLDGPLVAADVHRYQSPLDMLLDALGSEYDQVTLRLHPTLFDVRSFIWRGWDVAPAFQYEATLETDDPVTGWQRYPRKAFRKYRDSYALRRGASYLDAVLSLEAASLERKGLKSLGEDALATLAQRVLDAGLGEVLVVENNAGLVEAGVVATFDPPLDGTTATYWMVGSQRGPAMTVLIGHLARYAKERGCRQLCFGGANVPSVAEFKRGFGATLTPYFRVRLVTPTTLRVRDTLGRVFGQR